MSTTVVDKRTAAKLERNDHLELMVLDERAGRLQAQANALQQQIAALQREHEETMAARAELLGAISTGYDLIRSDNINIRTGEIVRAPRTEPAPPPPALKSVPAPTDDPAPSA